MSLVGDDPYDELSRSDEYRAHQTVAEDRARRLLRIVRNGLLHDLRTRLDSSSPPSSAELDALLYVACWNGDLEIVRELLRCGASVSAMPEFGSSHLHQAIRDQMPRLVKTFLKKNAGGAAFGPSKGKDLGTPLHCACESGHVSVVKELLEHGADVNAQDSHWFTPLHYASREGQTLAVAALLVVKVDGMNVDAVTWAGSDTPLHLACQEGYLHTVVELVETGNANVNHRADGGRSPLHDACEHGRAEIVKYLIEKGAYVDSRNCFHHTSLHTACFKGRGAIVRALLDGGADVGAVQEPFGCTALHMASRKGCTESVTALLEWNADINAMDRDGDTSLHFASGRGHEDVVQVLLDRGAAVGLRNSTGKTALDVAKQRKHASVITVLQDSVTRLFRLVHEAAEADDKQRLGSIRQAADSSRNKKRKREE